MKCSSCGNKRDLAKCRCGAVASGYRKNGDIGFQVNLGKRSLKPKFVYAAGKLKKAN